APPRRPSPCSSHGPARRPLGLSAPRRSESASLALPAKSSSSRSRLVTCNVQVATLSGVMSVSAYDRFVAAADHPDPTAGRNQPSAPDEPGRSALADALAAVGDRWTLLLIAALLDGPLRFGELQDEVVGIAPNVLSQRLRQLER